MTAHYVSPVRHAWEYPSYISILYGYIRYFRTIFRTDWVGKTLRQNRKNGIQIRASQLVKTCKVFGSNFQTAAFNQRPPKKLANWGARLVFRLVKGYSNSPPYSFLILSHPDSRCYNKKYLDPWTFQKKTTRFFHTISSHIWHPFSDEMSWKSFWTPIIMFHNNQAPSPSTAERAKPRANLSTNHHPRFHLWICLATRWVGMFWRHGRGGIHLQYMDGWKSLKGPKPFKIPEVSWMFEVFPHQTQQKDWYFATHRYFFRVFSECTNYLVIVPHWWTIPYDLGMVRLDAKSSKVKVEAFSLRCLPPKFLSRLRARNAAPPWIDAALTDAHVFEGFFQCT